MPSVPDEVVVISAERGNLSHDQQLAAGARIVLLGQDVIRLVLHHLCLLDCITVSHVCVYWRCLAVGDPFLWTELNGNPAVIPVLWARSGAVPIHATLRIDEKTSAEVSTCLRENVSRFKGLAVIMRTWDNASSIAWTELLRLICQPVPYLKRLHLESPSQGGEFPVFPPAAFRFPNSAFGLYELSIMNMRVTDFTRLPPTLTSFAYDYSPGGVVTFTLRDLDIIMQTCPALQELWVSVDGFHLSPPEFDAAGTPPITLKRLSLGYGSFFGILRTLEYLGHAGFEHLDVYDDLDFPVHAILRDFQAKDIVVYRPTWSYGQCDVLASDSTDRTRCVRATTLQNISGYPRLWESITALTLCGDLVKPLNHPPPTVIHLERLVLFYHRGTVRRTLETIEPWRQGSDPWCCPKLRALEFALAAGSSYMQLQPITLLGEALLRFVSEELSSANLTRVLVRGPANGWRVQTTPEQSASYPFSLESDHTAYEVRSAPGTGFEGFHRDE
ncbi:hypothetical protein EXIGLDRAFT_770500 [Exidia glandulosa HHB12029]|uniref:F-box domain-containing protein n=1 Tax=Exidia glandulosa HHB12029 TaxID=1314781 RepID=A0A165GML8_EXIGL|nr:hypothetical protein EXIGLDRAFT_770500 [Exidia glandulosa HHB12029]